MPVTAPWNCAISAGEGAGWGALPATVSLSGRIPVGEVTELGARE